MPAPTSATLTGPTSGICGVQSTDFTVTLDQPALTGGVVVTVVDSKGDVITSSPFTILEGDTTGTFKITPVSGGNRGISITTAPVLTYHGSPIIYTALCTATLTGPTSGMCSLDSADFTVTLSNRDAMGDVVVTVVDDVAGDVVTLSPFTIHAGNTTGTFKIKPVTCGDRFISITTVPEVTIVGSPFDYNALCNCPDDAATIPRVQTWPATVTGCPPTFFRGSTITPSTVWAKDLYCSVSPLTLIVTE